VSVSEVCLFVCFDLDISVVAARRLDGSLKRVAKGGEARRGQIWRRGRKEGGSEFGGDRHHTHS